MRFAPWFARTVSVLLGMSSAAHAADTWTTPFPGVRHLHRTTTNQNIHVSVIDTRAKGISFRATATGERGKRVSTFAGNVGAEVAVNGDFYNLDGTFQTYALSMSGGVAWPDTASKLQDGRIVFGANRMKLFRDNGIPAIEPWFKEVVSGHFTVLVDGQFTGDPNDPRNPRTAVGTDANNRTLFLAVVDGRASTRIGMNSSELAALMKGLGASNALSLDGGGSSTMFHKGAGVLNRPSDGSERTVANHLAVFAKGMGEPASCGPFLAAKTDGTTNEVVAEGEPGAEVEVAIRLRNRGEKAWTPSVTKVGPLPKDMASSIAGSDWPGPTRAFVFAKVVPGTEVADVKFKVRIPASGETKQAFALLDEGVRWFGDPAKPDAEPEVFSVIARSKTTASVAVDAGTAIDPVEEDEPDSLSEVSPDSGCKAGRDPSVPAAYLLGIGALFVLRRRRQPR